MAFGIVFLTVSSALLLLYALRSRYGLPLFLMTAGMSACSSAVLFQTYNTSMYSPPAYFPLRSLDLDLYRLIGSRRLPLFQMQLLRTAGCLCFFAGVILLLTLICRNFKESRIRPGRMAAVGAVLLAYFLGYAVLYSPQCAYGMYLKYYALSGPAREGFRQAVTALDRGMRLLALPVLLSPALLLAVQYWKKNVTYFADTFFLLTGMTLLYAAVFYTAFFTGPFAQSSESVFRSGFWYFSSLKRIPDRIVLVFPLFSLLILVFIVASTNRVFSGELVLLSRKRAMKNSIEELNRNLKDVFHSEKNLMFSILILANEAKDAYGTKEGMAKLERLTEVAQNRMEIISSSLNRIRELNLHAVPVDMRRTVEQALEDAAIPEDIRCETRFCSFPARCVIDEYHTRSALKNLFANSVDALQLSDREDKVLAVTVEASRAWVSISVRDNGTGIARKEIRRVMLPFVSTKSKTSNWGIGLPYAFRVVNAQLGQMRILSSDRPERQFTQVDILLPRERRNHS